MPGERPPWTFRTCADYDPNYIGAVSQAKIVAALVQAGKTVFLPVMQVPRCDLVMEDGGRLFRVQCKTGHLFRGAVYFPTRSLRAARRETEWRRVVKDYQDDIDYFAVYCPDNEKVYLVPLADASSKWMTYLRIEPAKNNQKKRIRLAKDYEIGGVAVQSEVLA